MAHLLTYEQIYRNLDGMIALQVAASMPLRKQKDEKDIAFVKRVVATYIMVAAQNGVHDLVGSGSQGS